LSAIHANLASVLSTTLLARTINSFALASEGAHTQRCAFAVAITCIALQAGVWHQVAGIRRHGSV